MQELAKRIPRHLLEDPGFPIPPADADLLLQLSDAITRTPDTTQLFARIIELLQPVFHFSMSGLHLLSEDGGFIESFSPAFLLPENGLPSGIPSYRTPASALEPYPPIDSLDFHRLRVEDMTEVPDDPSDVRRFLIDAGIQEEILCPLLHCGRSIGQLFLSIGARAFPDEKLPLLRRVCQQIAGTVATSVAYERLARKERIAKSTIRLTSRLMRRRNLSTFAEDLAEGLRELYPLVHLSMHGLPGGIPATNLVLTDGAWRECGDPAVPWIGEADDREGTVLRNHEPGELEEAFADRPDVLERLARWKVTAGAHVRLQPSDSSPITLFLGVDADASEQSTNPEALELVMPQVLLVLQGLVHWERSQELQRRLQEENQALKEEMASPPGEELVTGQSHAFRICLSLARQVAPLDSTVLLLGETGTGKEVLANDLHRHSSRSAKPFVRINCASLPAGLIESELFGHEKGAFTGAVDRRLGKFELAHGGTVFLDEVGELPLESQAKLLRVLQERELERLGGQAVIPVDVRVIAATNRSLEEEVRASRFRADLFYRLNVFPLLLPPLRERQDDIPVLADVFLAGFARRFGHPTRPLNDAEAGLLKAYHWPGNIRELKHTMERAVITSTNGEPNLLGFREACVASPPSVSDRRPILPMDEMVREHILDALRRTDGRVSGKNGAADLLALNAKTLESKMRKLGIRRRTDFGTST